MPFTYFCFHLIKTFILLNFKSYSEMYCLAWRDRMVKHLLFLGFNLIGNVIFFCILLKRHLWRPEIHVKYYWTLKRRKSSSTVSNYKFNRIFITQTPIFLKLLITRRHYCLHNFLCCPEIFKFYKNFEGKFKVWVIKFSLRILLFFD